MNKTSYIRISVNAPNPYSFSLAWVSSTEDRLFTSRLDGSNPQLIYQMNFKDLGPQRGVMPGIGLVPSGLTANNNYFFWTDRDQEANIQI